jgi:hypothetical protein
LKLYQNSYKILVSVILKLCQNAKTVSAGFGILAGFGSFDRFWHFGVQQFWHYVKSFNFWHWAK